MDVGPLFAEIELHDGRKVRAGPDEADVLDTPTKIEFSTDSHGFGPGSIVLPRPDQWDPLAGQEWASTRIYDEAGRNVHEGRISGRPQAGANEITLELEGWSKHGEDNETAMFLGVARDLSSWRGISQQLQIRWIDAGYTPIGGSETRPSNDGLPTMVLQLPHPGKPLAHAVFESSMPIGEISGEASVRGTGVPGASYLFQVVLSDVEDYPAGAYDVSADLESSTPNSFSSVATSDSRKYAHIHYYRSAAAVTGTFEINGYVKKLAVWGTHGLTKRGTAPDQGLLVSDMVRHLVERYCPKWILAGDSIEQTSFLVPHAAWLEDTTAAAMLEALLLFGGSTAQPLDWAVWDDRTFYLRSPGQGEQWRFRRDEGAEPSSAGPEAQERIAGVKVSYNDGSGETKTVGAPGTNANVETTALADSSPSNPVVAAGLPRYKGIDAGVTNESGARLLGQLYLTERNRRQWRGDIDVKGIVRTQSGAAQPAYMVRALDSGVVEDDSDPRERRIVDTTYDSDRRATRASVGADPDRFDVLLARAGVAVKDIGL